MTCCKAASQTNKPDQIITVSGACCSKIGLASQYLLDTFFGLARRLFEVHDQQPRLRHIFNRRANTLSP